MSVVAMYFFQGDLGETLEYPNAFVIPNTAKPTFGHFLSHFPAHEKAGLHFRFRMEDATSDYVWLDISSPDEILPFYQDSIMAKVLRTDEAITLKRKTVLRRKNMENLSGSIVTGGAAVFSKPEPSPTAPAPLPRRQESRPVSSSSPKPYTDETASTKPPPVPVKQAPAKQAPPKPALAPKPAPAAKSVPPPVSAPEPALAPTPVKDMLGDDFEASAPSPNTSTKAGAKSAPSSAPVEDMLDFGDGPAPTVAASKNTSQKSSNADLASMMDLDGTPTMSRAELKANKDEKINNQVQKALEEKMEQDRKKDQEQIDFDTARATHDQKLLAWSTNNKERRNIRSLLSTMHTVLWEGTRWKTIGLGDVLEPKQVKLQYRKAMLVVHPDHNVNLTNEHRYICKRIFEAVNEAYNEFTTKENV